MQYQRLVWAETVNNLQPTTNFAYAAIKFETLLKSPSLELILYTPITEMAFIWHINLLNQFPKSGCTVMGSPVLLISGENISTARTDILICVHCNLLLSPVTPKSKDSHNIYSWGAYQLQLAGTSLRQNLTCCSSGNHYIGYRGHTVVYTDIYYP